MKSLLEVKSVQVVKKCPISILPKGTLTKKKLKIKFVCFLDVFVRVLEISLWCPGVLCCTA